MPLAAAPPQLLTAEEYFGLHLDRPTELVRGRIVDMSRPAPIHGYVMMNFGRVLGNFAIANKLGRIVGGDSAVITERDPDSVRGPDVAFYSFAKIPPGPMPQDWLEVVPDFVVEIRSKHDRRRDILQKVGEYLAAGVTAVLNFDPISLTLEIHRDDETQTFRGDDAWSLPDLLPGFSATVRELAE